jgi:hypothetical protein
VREIRKKATFIKSTEDAIIETVSPDASSVLKGPEHKE